MKQTMQILHPKMKSNRFRNNEIEYILTRNYQYVLMHLFFIYTLRIIKSCVCAIINTTGNKIFTYKNKCKIN